MRADSGGRSSVQKVGMVCPYDWSYPGGVRTHIVGLANALRRKGIDVEIMAPASTADATIYALGRTVGIPYNGSVARLNFSFAARTRIAERLRGGDIDLLHIHEPFSPSVSFLALMQSSLPIVATFHMSRERSIAYFVARPLLEHFGRKIDHRIVVSEAARSLITRYLPPRSGAETLLPNAIEVGRYRSASPDPALEALKPFVLFVGRHEPRKGLRVLARAMERVRQDADARLVIAGAGNDEVLELLGEVPEWIHALGPVPHEKLPSVYAAADVFCAPSLGGESFGLILTEAMATGRPVVASDIRGYRNAAGGAALFSPPRDAEALAASLVSVLTDSGLAADLSKRAQARASEFDWEELVDRVIEIYRSASGGSMMAAS